MENMIYLDNAATTRLDEAVLESMLPYMRSGFGNPSAAHGHGRQAKLAIEQSRRLIAQHLHAQPTEIFFTSGGTESNNTAIVCAVRDLHCRHIISSPIEHPAVINAIDHHVKSGMATRSLVKLLPDGHVDLADLEMQLKSQKERCLVSLMHGNNEIGNLLDIEVVAKLCQQYRAIFHSDCVQTIGHYPIDLSKLPVHFVSASGHKFHGPKGVGILYIKNDISVRPLIFGGGQERNMRAGTENVYGIVGLAKALDIAMQQLETDSTYISNLKRYMAQQLSSFSSVRFNGCPTRSLYTVLSVSFPEAPMLLVNLDEKNICVSGGSACSSGKGESHVIKAIGANKGRTTLRFSFSKYNCTRDIDAVMVNLEELLHVNS